MLPSAGNGDETAAANAGTQHPSQPSGEFAPTAFLIRLTATIADFEGMS